MCTCKTTFLYFLTLYNIFLNYLSFSDEWALEEHIKIHVGQGKYFCEICGKSCGTISILNKHIQLHCDDRKYIEKRNNQQKTNICTVNNVYMKI